MAEAWAARPADRARVPSSESPNQCTTSSALAAHRRAGSPFESSVGGRDPQRGEHAEDRRWSGVTRAGRRRGDPRRARGSRAGRAGRSSSAGRRQWPARRTSLLTDGSTRGTPRSPVSGYAPAAARTAASSAPVDGRAASRRAGGREDGSVDGALGDRAHGDGGAGRPAERRARAAASPPTRASASARRDGRGHRSGGGCRGRGGRARGTSRGVISSQPMPAAPVAHGSTPASPAEWHRLGVAARRAGAPPGRTIRTGSPGGAARASSTIREAARLRAPLVGEHEVEGRGGRAPAAPARARPRPARNAAWARRAPSASIAGSAIPSATDSNAAIHPPSRDRAGSHGEVGLRDRRSLEQHLGVADEHECGVGQPRRGGRTFSQQRDAGLPLEHRELLRDRRRRELQRVGDRRPRSRAHAARGAGAGGGDRAR